jgi:hypothetical protein
MISVITRVQFPGIFGKESVLSRSAALSGLFEIFRL